MCFRFQRNLVRRLTEGMYSVNGVPVICHWKPTCPNLQTRDAIEGYDWSNGVLLCYVIFLQNYYKTIRCYKLFDLRCHKLEISLTCILWILSMYTSFQQKYLRNNPFCYLWSNFSTNKIRYIIYARIKISIENTYKRKLVF